jgi:hypothetical protein
VHWGKGKSGRRRGSAGSSGGDVGLNFELVKAVLGHKICFKGARGAGGWLL